MGSNYIPNSKTLRIISLLNEYRLKIGMSRIVIKIKLYAIFEILFTNLEKRNEVPLFLLISQLSERIFFTTNKFYLV